MKLSGGGKFTHRLSRAHSKLLYTMTMIKPYPTVSPMVARVSNEIQYQKKSLERAIINAVCLSLISFCMASCLSI